MITENIDKLLKLIDVVRAENDGCEGIELATDKNTVDILKNSGLMPEDVVYTVFPYDSKILVIPIWGYEPFGMSRKVGVYE